MKFTIRILPLLLLLPLLGCSKKEYDISNGINQEITLFQDEIELPLGNAGPVTIKDMLNNSPNFASLFEMALKEDEDGVFYLESEDEIFKENAYQLALDIPDPTQPYSWALGDKHAYIAPLANALRMIGFVFPNQQLIIQGKNPLWSKLGIHTRAQIVCVNASGEETYVKEINLSDFAMEVRGMATTLATVEYPRGLVEITDKVTLKNLTIDIPANLKSEIRPAGEDSFVFSTKFKTQVALPRTFDFPFTLPLSFELPAARYYMHRIALSFDLLNSIPLDVTVEGGRALDQDGRTIPGIVISADKTIVGGKISAPGITSLTLVVEATDGIIPDLYGVSLDLHARYPEGLGVVPLSSLMGLSIQSAFVKLDGGITLNGNE